MSWTYYVDGYNVIHHSSILKPLAHQDFESARDALIHKVARFCAGTGCRTTIVFDGRGHRSENATPFEGAPTLQVIYSCRARSADAVIERMVYAATNRRDIIVVTADRGIRDWCMGLGALTMAPDKFLATAREAHGHIAISLERLRRANAFGSIGDRFDAATRERMRRLHHRLSG